MTSRHYFSLSFLILGFTELNEWIPCFGICAFFLIVQGIDEITKEKKRIK